jgi:hypothetical protein
MNDESGEFAGPEIHLTYSVSENNVFTIYQDGEAVFTSRPYRLRVQAEEGARDFIRNAEGGAVGGITLDVQSVSMDVEAILGKLNKG